MYVFISNRRVHAHWSHLKCDSQMLPTRITLRRNIDVAGALIAANFVHIVCFFLVNFTGVFTCIMHAPVMPPVMLVSERLFLLSLCASQAIYCDLLPRIFIGTDMLLHPWTLINKMPALRDSCFVAPMFKRGKDVVIWIDWKMFL